MSSPFRCPACNFAVFNRRVHRCEKCGRELPENLRFTASDLALIAAEAARVEKARRELQRDREEEERKREQRRGSGG
jgi:hypothetical protein